MLFLIYWELNEETPFEQRLQAAQTLMSKGLVPGKGVKLLRWDITPSGWGVTVSEADSVMDIGRSIDIWRAAIPGFFKTVKIAPAMPIMEGMPAFVETLELVKS
jgi:Domain of unknown function (DUF3303)